MQLVVHSIDGQRVYFRQTDPESAAYVVDRDERTFHVIARDSLADVTVGQRWTLALRRSDPCPENSLP